MANPVGVAAADVQRVKEGSVGEEGHGYTMIQMMQDDGRRQKWSKLSRAPFASPHQDKDQPILMGFLMKFQ